MKYLNSAIASDGGTTWLALEGEDSTLYELKLDNKIGSTTPNRLFVNEALVGINEEETWVQILRETIVESVFEHESEKEMVESVISTLVNRK